MLPTHTPPSPPGVTRPRPRPGFPPEPLDPARTDPRVAAQRVPGRGAALEALAGVTGDATPTTYAASAPVAVAATSPTTTATTTATTATTATPATPAAAAASATTAAAAGSTTTRTRPRATTAATATLPPTPAWLQDRRRLATPDAPPSPSDPHADALEIEIAQQVQWREIRNQPEELRSLLAFTLGVPADDGHGDAGQDLFRSLLNERLPLGMVMTCLHRLALEALSAHCAGPAGAWVQDRLNGCAAAYTAGAIGAADYQREMLDILRELAPHTRRVALPPEQLALRAELRQLGLVPADGSFPDDMQPCMCSLDSDRMRAFMARQFARACPFLAGRPDAGALAAGMRDLVADILEHAETMAIQGQEREEQERGTSRHALQLVRTRQITFETFEVGQTVVEESALSPERQAIALQALETAVQEWLDRRNWLAPPPVADADAVAASSQPALETPFIDSWRRLLRQTVNSPPAQARYWRDGHSILSHDLAARIDGMVGQARHDPVQVGALRRRLTDSFDACMTMCGIEGDDRRHWKQVARHQL